MLQLRCNKTTFLTKVFLLSKIKENRFLGISQKPHWDRQSWSRHFGGRRFQEKKRSFLLEAQEFTAQHYKKHPQSDTEEEDDQAPKSTHHHTSSKLHKLKLSRFNGDYLAWSEFRDSFEADVHTNKYLCEVSKFNYLNPAQLDREAASTIGGFRLSKQNYKEAVDMLQARFGQPAKIQRAHLRALVNLMKPNDNPEST